MTNREIKLLLDAVGVKSCLFTLLDGREFEYENDGECISSLVEIKNKQPVEPTPKKVEEKKPEDVPQRKKIQDDDPVYELADGTVLDRDRLGYLIEDENEPELISKDIMARICGCNRCDIDAILHYYVIPPRKEVDIVIRKMNAVFPHIGLYDAKLLIDKRAANPAGYFNVNFSQLIEVLKKRGVYSRIYTNQDNKTEDVTVPVSKEQPVPAQPDETPKLEDLDIEPQRFGNVFELLTPEEQEEYGKTGVIPERILNGNTAKPAVKPTVNSVLTVYDEIQNEDGTISDIEVPDHPELMTSQTLARITGLSYAYITTIIRQLRVNPIAKIKPAVGLKRRTHNLYDATVILRHRIIDERKSAGQNMFKPITSYIEMELERRGYHK